MLFTSCEECNHEGDRSIASSLQVGDVVCSDGSVLSKEKFSSSRKEPVAIVYHVNRNPEIKALGYAVSIRDVASAAFADSLGVEQETSASLEKEDGNENTHAMYRHEEVKSPLAVYNGFHKEAHSPRYRLLHSTDRICTHSFLRAS